MLTGQRKEDEAPSTPPSALTLTEEAVLRAYKDIFSRPVDPVGELHNWRILANIGDYQIDDGIYRVEELENFLEIHCKIKRIGRYGEQVLFDPSLHKPKDNIEIPPKTPVYIVEPGWQWQEQTLRYPKVVENNVE